MAPPLQGFAPLIQVFDMPRSVAFYREALGFAVVAQSHPGTEFDWCLLRRDGIELMLNTAYEREARPPEADPQRLAVHADTGFFFGCRDLDIAAGQLSALGVAVDGPRTAPYGMRQLWFADPDGYVICLQWPER
ncbi:MAG: glyoxalase [Rhodanobacter denitrificans]|uniref:Glyoxalase n=1 Tax=Rhodanobacter denitrificans TaxID=666685 RepID=A0A2W5KST0_9GAMM|nr:MAG: glyoxalase [Rhodanobacter denitrificans]